MHRGSASCPVLRAGAPAKICMTAGGRARGPRPARRATAWATR
jgi:hypothetical protein